MKVKEIIKELQKCNPELDIAVFDERNIPYEIKRIFIDERTEENKFSYIEIDYRYSEGNIV